MLGEVHRGEHLLERDARRFLADLDQLLLHPMQCGHIRGAFGLVHAEGGGGPAVQTRNAANLLDAVAHVGDIAQAGDATVGHRQAHLTELRGAVRAAEHPDRLLRTTHLGPTACGIDVHQPQLLIDLAGRDAVGLHARRIEVDADLARDTAGARDLCDAGDRQKPLADRVVHEPRQLLLTHARGADGEVHDRPAVHVQALHLRLENSLR